MLDKQIQEEIQNELFPLQRLTEEQRCLVKAIITCFAQSNGLKRIKEKEAS